MFVIGTMTGTSKDGINFSLMEMNEEGTEPWEKGSLYIPYDDDFKILLNAAEYAVKTCQGDIEKAKGYYSAALEHYLKTERDMKDYAIHEKISQFAKYLNPENPKDVTYDAVVQRLTELHRQGVEQLLQKAKLKPQNISLIGCHGQTLYHNPSIRVTVQVTDCQQLADSSEILVIGDFRQNDVAHGGQGAPFAPLYHQALLQREKPPINSAAILNCGGIANVTLVIGKEIKKGFDTGPGNGLLDSYIMRRTEGREKMDEDGKHGKEGKVDQKVFRLLYQEAVKAKNNQNYFKLDPPKSLDKNDLQLTENIVQALNQLTLEDACRTLEAFTADTIVRCLELLKPSDIPETWLLAGGGWNNPVIVEELQERLKNKFQALGFNFMPRVMNVDKLGWNSESLEAQIFAYLGVRALLGQPLSIPATTGVQEPLCGGQAYRPKQAEQLPEFVEKALARNPAVLTGYRMMTPVPAKSR